MPRRPIVQASYGPGGRIYFPETHGAVAARAGVAAETVETDFVSVNLDGGDRKVHLTFPFVDEAAVSPDGKRLLYQEGDNAYLIPFPLAGTGDVQPRVEHGRNSRFPVRQLSLEGGLFPHWRDSVTAEFANGNRIITVDTRTNKADTVTITLKVPKRIPSGTVALTNARIVTMENRQVIPSGTVVVRNGRISLPRHLRHAGRAGDRRDGQDHHPGPDRSARASSPRSRGRAAEEELGVGDLHGVRCDDDARQLDVDAATSSRPRR